MKKRGGGEMSIGAYVTHLSLIDCFDIHHKYSDLSISQPFYFPSPLLVFGLLKTISFDTIMSKNVPELPNMGLGRRN